MLLTSAIKIKTADEIFPRAKCHRVRVDPEYCLSRPFEQNYYYFVHQDEYEFSPNGKITTEVYWSFIELAEECKDEFKKDHGFYGHGIVPIFTTKERANKYLSSFIKQLKEPSFNWHVSRFDLNLITKLLIRDVSHVVIDPGDIDIVYKTNVTSSLKPPKFDT